MLYKKTLNLHNVVTILCIVLNILTLYQIRTTLVKFYYRSTLFLSYYYYYHHPADISVHFSYFSCWYTHDWCGHIIREAPCALGGAVPVWHEWVLLCMLYCVWTLVQLYHLGYVLSFLHIYTPTKNTLID